MTKLRFLLKKISFNPKILVAGANATTASGAVAGVTIPPDIIVAVTIGIVALMHPITMHHFALLTDYVLITLLARFLSSSIMSTFSCNAFAKSRSL